MSATTSSTDSERPDPDPKPTDVISSTDATEVDQESSDDGNTEESQVGEPPPDNGGQPGDDLD